MQEELEFELKRLKIKLEVFVDKDVTTNLIHEGEVIFNTSSSMIEVCYRDCLDFIQNDLGI